MSTVERHIAKKLVQQICVYNVRKLQYSSKLVCYHNINTVVLPPPPQPFYGPFSGTTRVSRCQKRTSGLYGARED